MKNDLQTTNYDFNQRKFTLFDPSGPDYSKMFKRRPKAVEGATNTVLVSEIVCRPVDLKRGRMRGKFIGRHWRAYLHHDLHLQVQKEQK